MNIGTLQHQNTSKNEKNHQDTESAYADWAL